MISVEVLLATSNMSDRKICKETKRLSTLKNCVVVLYLQGFSCQLW